MSKIHQVIGGLTEREYRDIVRCAEEREVTLMKLIHDAVMEDLHR